MLELVTKSRLRIGARSGRPLPANGARRRLPRVAARERLHKLVDELPEDAMAEAFALVSDLAQAGDGRLSQNEFGQN